MTKEQMMQWIIDNNAQILRGPAMKWTNAQGEEFYCNFTLAAKNTQYPAFPTLEEAIIYAANCSHLE